MTADAILAIVLNVAIPSILAILGGILAVRSLPVGAVKYERWLWVSAFLGLALIAIVLSFVQQVRTTTQQREADEKSARTVNDLRSDGKYTQGQLDSINKVLTAIVANPQANSSGTQKALEALLFTTMSAQTKSQQEIDSQIKAQYVSNAELSKRGIDFANRLRKFHSDWQQKEMATWNLATRGTPGMTPEQRAEYARNYDQIYAQRDLEYKTVFVGEAIYLRDELISRLKAKGEQDVNPTPDPVIKQFAPTMPDTNSTSVAIALSGSLAGGADSALADYIEKLSRKLALPK